ncbi:hypothetical protein EVAR_63308_1 [Eumeta japonica]|uniref:Uncharacterized protein n=1 Tax=Eumeta variegata TaxID=151549 RepID=A0A4C1ZAF2_EUMVA|nr:hypothetical protein EVAR_63308_1 [Eumeta japonica]
MLWLSPVAYVVVDLVREVPAAQPTQPTLLWERWVRNRITLTMALPPFLMAPTGTLGAAERPAGTAPAPTPPTAYETPQLHLCLCC